MNISIIGTGYVGLVTGTCLADMGHNVHCIDINKEKINNLNNGIVPIYEPGLKELIEKNIKANKLFFTNEYDCINLSEAVICAVGTPNNENNETNLDYVKEAAEYFAMNINKRTLFIIKSTVPVGTSKIIKELIDDVIDNRKEDYDIEYDMVSNPEFLKEGSAIKDFMNPDRIIIGCDSEYAKIVMGSMYKSFPSDKILFTSIESAELIKHSSNAMLATRISFINEIANLCDKTGANIDEVSKGIGLDIRIGDKFLKAGCGYGGSCFPKDIKSLITVGKSYGLDMKVITAVNEANNVQKHILYKKLYNASSKVDYSIKNIAILGTSFKPDTDDMREATSIVFINDLLNDELRLGPFDKIKIYDPIALNNCKRIIGETNEKIEYCEELDKAIIDADAIVIITEWKQIKDMSLDIVKRLMNGNIIIDGRNIFERNIVEDIGFIYECIGK